MIVLLDAAPPMAMLLDELTHGPMLSVIAGIVVAGLVIAAFFVFRKKK